MVWKSGARGQLSPAVCTATYSILQREATKETQISKRGRQNSLEATCPAVSTPFTSSGQSVLAATGESIHVQVDASHLLSRLSPAMKEQTQERCLVLVRRNHAALTPHAAGQCVPHPTPFCSRPPSPHPRKMSLGMMKAPAQARIQTSNPNQCVLKAVLSAANGSKFTAR